MSPDQDCLTAREITVQLIEVLGETPPLEATVRIDPCSISLRFAGYGDRTSKTGHGEPVLIENRAGVPVVVVWGDINQDDPTDIVALTNARESRRENESPG
jgi:hypothetical protein